VGGGEHRDRTGAAFHHFHAAARLQGHCVGIDGAAEQVVLPAAGDVAPHQAGIVGDSETLQAGCEFIGHRQSVGLRNYFLANQVGATIDGVAQAAGEESSVTPGKLTSIRAPSVETSQPVI